MTDFFASMGSSMYAELLQKQAQAAKPTNQMTPVEWAEYQVLDALARAEALRAQLVYVRITGRMPEDA